jgi:hypothetical protein
MSGQEAWSQTLRMPLDIPEDAGTIRLRTPAAEVGPARNRPRPLRTPEVLYRNTGRPRATPRTIAFSELSLCPKRSCPLSLKEKPRAKAGVGQPQLKASLYS